MVVFNSGIAFYIYDVLSIAYIREFWVKMAHFLNLMFKMGTF